MLFGSVRHRDPVQHSYHSSASEIQVDLNSESLAVVVVDHAEGAEPASVRPFSTAFNCVLLNFESLHPRASFAYHQPETPFISCTILRDAYMWPEAVVIILECLYFFHCVSP